MKIYTNEDLRNFEFWSGAYDHARNLSTDELDQIEAILEDVAPQGMSATQVNDFFWFETDTIADWLGYESWELMMAEKDCLETCPVGDDSCPYFKGGKCTLDCPMNDCDDYATLMSE